MSHAQKECPSCALPVDADADICPHCGYEFPHQKLSYQAAAILFIGLMLLWLLWETM